MRSLHPGQLTLDQRRYEALRLDPLPTFLFAFLS
jgi:hypothetical protein